MYDKYKNQIFIENKSSLPHIFHIIHHYSNPIYMLLYNVLGQCLLKGSILSHDWAA